MAPKSGNKQSKPKRGQASGSASPRRARQLNGPPTPAADIPHPLGELPPATMSRRGINPQNRINDIPGEDSRRHLNADPVSTRSAVDKPSETANKSEARRVVKSRAEFIR